VDAHVKSARAKSLLEDEVLKDAFDVVREYHTSVFLDPEAGEGAIMEAARAVRSLSLIERQLQSYVDDGRLLERKQRKGSAP
jgi:hypothetical protein|tara:strand:- start:2795 stop:3040 length:246 start_codon:yes stop_codon:yes gene_type:complete